MSTSKPDDVAVSTTSTAGSVPASSTHKDQPHSSSSQLPSAPYKITAVRTPDDLKAITTLFASYAASLNLDLSFQDFANEMAGLPGKYAPDQGGELLIARRRPTLESTAHEHPKDNGEAIGCVALRSLMVPGLGNASEDVEICEMKRLYTTPAARGLGLGRALAREVVDIAKQRGYTEMRLDTLPTMGPAQKLYAELGFRDIEQYCENPVDGVRFLGLDLRE